MQFFIWLWKSWEDDHIKTISSSFVILLDGKFDGITFPYYRIEKQLPIWFPMGIDFDVHDNQLMYEPASGAVIGRMFASNVTSVGVSEESLLSTFCAFDFTDFPMDIQQCQIQLSNKFAHEIQPILYDAEGIFYNGRSSEQHGFRITTTFEEGVIMNICYYNQNTDASNPLSVCVTILSTSCSYCYNFSSQFHYPSFFYTGKGRTRRHLVFDINKHLHL